MLPPIEVGDRNMYVLCARVEMVCPPLSPPQNGFLDGTDISHGCIVVSSCLPGFMFADGNLTEHLQCVTDGAQQPEAMWSSTVRDCQRTYFIYMTIGALTLD